MENKNVFSHFYKFFPSQTEFLFIKHANLFIKILFFFLFFRLMKINELTYNTYIYVLIIKKYYHHFGIWK